MEKVGYSEELTQRLSSVESRLSTFEKSAIDFDSTNGLVKYWMDLRMDLIPAIERAKSKGETEAKVIQFADAFINIDSERKIADTFFDLFGAKTQLTKGEGAGMEVRVSSSTFRTVLNGSEVDVDGSIVFDTDIDGVRMKVDGSAVTSFDNSPSKSVRPILLVKTS